MGKGQSLRGVKYLDARPDGVFGDDLEEPEDVRTPEARERLLNWFLFDLIPALDVNTAHARVAATPLDPEALPAQLIRAGWSHRRYPIEYVDDTGTRRATWPDREPIDKIDERRNAAVKVGKLRQYNQEFMCVSETAGEKAFRPEAFRIEPQVRTWQAVYGFFDPARTVGAQSATTGFACWSWIGGRLVVWDAWGKALMPDEQIKAMFDFNEEYHPAWIGVEEDGLNQWLLQPIRQEQSRRGVTLPLRAVKAPTGKLDFIRNSLQPFLNARELYFAKDLPDLKAQMMSFPTGKIDCPNALAYAVRMRSGAPMYEDFGGRNVMEEIAPVAGIKPWLLMGATNSMVTAVLVQTSGGALRILWDKVLEGEPSALAATILNEASLEVGAFRVMMGPQHFDQYNNFGLRQAVMKRMTEVRKGVGAEVGRPEVRKLLRQEIRSMPALLVAAQARWVSNGFAGGYARALLKGGMLAEHAEEGAYRVVMESIESFTGLMKTAVGDEDDEAREIHYDVTSNGRRYISALR